MRYLLDTNTCIAGMRNHPKVIQHLTEVAPADWAISTVTGFDVLLAGHALPLSLVVASANTKEFKRVPGLTVEDWQT